MVHHRRLGMVDSIIMRLDNAAREYDDKLFLDRHKDTGEWCVYIHVERPQPPYPVFSLGKTLPTVPELIDRLRKTDSHRQDIRAEMNRANAAIVAEIDAKTREEIGKAAEAVEYIARKQNMMADNTSRRKIVKQ